MKKAILLTLLVTILNIKPIWAKKYMHYYYGGVNLFQTISLFETFESIISDDEAEVKELFIVFNSGGGSVMHMEAQIKLIEAYQKKGISVNTVVFDNCHSACVNLFLTGEKRYIMSNSYMVVHQPRFGRSGRLNYLDLIDLKASSVRLIKSQCKALKMTQEECSEYYKRTRSDLVLRPVDLILRGFGHKIIEDYRDLLND